MPSAPAGPRHGDPGEAVAVGRGRLEHRLRLVGDVEEDAVQIVARLFGRDGEAGLVDDLAKGRGGKLEAGRQVALGDHREIVARQGREVEAGAAGIDLHLALGGVQLDLAALGKLAGDVEQGVGGDGGRARLGDVGLDRLDDLEVEVGRHQPEAAALGRLDQDVGEDRDRVPPLHHGLDVAEALEERCPFDRRLHRVPQMESGSEY